MKTFILRLEVDETGEVVGVVERVRSGEKERFHGYAMLRDVIKGMVASDDRPPARTITTNAARLCQQRQGGGR